MVSPLWGDMPLEKIDAPTVLSVLRRVEGRGVVITAHKVKAISRRYSNMP